MPTPMQKQYQEIKKEHQDAVLFFRLGDFYEMFGDDAIESSKILGITLTARHKGKPNEIPMCGIPHHAAENYIVKLTKAGKKVAICDQVSPPGDGIVERKVVRIITPGTTIDSNILDDKTNNYIGSIVQNNATIGFAFADTGTGEFYFNETQDQNLLTSVLTRLRPSEIILPHMLREDLGSIEEMFSEIVFHSHDPAIGFNAHDTLTAHFNVPRLEGFGITDATSKSDAAGRLLHYLEDTQKTNLSHISAMSEYHFEHYLALDNVTIRNLELLYTLYEGKTEGSLLSIIDSSQTAMGGRMLRNWLMHPLMSLARIEERLNAVEAIQRLETDTIVEHLSHIADIERILGKIGLERANARDLIALKVSLEKIKDLKTVVPEGSLAPLLESVAHHLNSHDDLVRLLDSAIVDEPPIEITEAGMMKRGYNQELDELHKISTTGKDWIANLTASEIERTGIASLKVKFNKIFGYYIEISKANLTKIPENYERKQTLVNAERFITPELKEFEEKILSAEEKIKTKEYDLFLELRKTIAEKIPDIQKTARSVATLDVLTSFATHAERFHYCKPTITENSELHIEDGRHPVIEQMLEDKSFIPNSTDLSKDTFVHLITGPNMSGKSSYLRQIALITLLGQIGSFVPAKSATLPIVDRIFTRVGAGDNLAQGESTFMMEMHETAHILHNATERSLIILDELGRGTSTYDGLSIAWAVLEHIHKVTRAKTLFATHYHELIEVVDTLQHAKNYHVSATEHEGKLIFLHKVTVGGMPDSYGIEVAELAGIPNTIIERSKRILQKLETQEPGSKKPTPEKPSKSDPLREELASLDPNTLTPLEALQKLVELKRNIDKSTT